MRGAGPSLWVLALAAGCYHGAAATADITDAWRGRARAELEARWGRPDGVAPDGNRTLLRFTHTRRDIELPGGSGGLTVGPGHAEGWAELHPESITTRATDVIATIDGAERIAEIRGPSVDWGAPGDSNLHWGAIFGLHVGMGRLDDTGTPLPSGGAYVGGMLTPHLGLVGAYALVSGSADAGSAMGMAWSCDAQWWPVRRGSLRAGPAMVLAFEPGFANPRLRPGVDGSASVVAFQVGTFVLDLRVELIAAPQTVFGSLGVGVNVN